MTFLQMLITSLFAFLFTRAVGAVVAPDGETSAATRPRPMVRCVACGVYVLRERALVLPSGAFACSTTCRARR